MKKRLVLLLLSVLLVLSACAQTPSTATTAPTKTVEILTIVDLAVRDGIPCDAAIEHFYSSGENSYFFPCMKSRYVLVRYTDGTEETVTQALESGRISIADLDRFGIAYEIFTSCECG